MTEHGVPVFTDMPKGCIIRHAPDDAHGPLISAGEAAVIDVADTELVPGKFYLYRQMTCDRMCT